MDDSGTVLYPNEIDAYLESLQIFDITEIGSLRYVLIDLELTAFIYGTLKCLNSVNNNCDWWKCTI